MRHWSGVGQTRGFHHHPVEVQGATAAPFGQIGQRAAQVFADGAAHAAIVHLDDLFGRIGNKNIVVDGFFAEFVFDDGNFLTMGFGEKAFEQCGFAGTQKTGDDGCGNEGWCKWQAMHYEAAW